MADDKSGGKHDGKLSPGWLKAEVVFKAAGGFMTAVVVLLVGNWLNTSLRSSENLEAKSRLYAELVSRREEADTALRKDMLKSIMEAVLSKETSPLNDRILKLELLACNFHDSLNLKPLFAHLEREIPKDPKEDEEAKKSYLRRLRKTAIAINRKHIALLEGVGRVSGRDVTVTGAADGPEQAALQLEPCDLTLNGIQREFRITIEHIDPAHSELEILLEVRTPQQEAADQDYLVAEFGVGFFDFPMVDNIRLSGDQRCAVALTAFEGGDAELVLLYFPGVYASLKEKAYYEDVMNTLLSSSLFGTAQD